MAFNEIGFLFVFFPVVIALHAIMPMRLKNILLLLASLVFFAWGTPEYLLLMVLIILYNYLAGLQLAHCKAIENPTYGKWVLIISVAVNVLLLGFFKYWGFLVENVGALFHTNWTARPLPMPIGVSFFTFSVLSYLFDVYRDRAPAAKNILNFALFVTFFPKLVSGPIVQYGEMEQQLKNRKLTASKLGSGSRLFLIGLAKKVLLANTLGTTFYAVTALAPEEVSIVTAWIGTVTYSLMLYFDFSGYSDMAIGLAEMFGFHFEKNFNYPYAANSITDFWRRWHISLGAWFRDYVYIPMGGSRHGTRNTIRNLAVVWLLTGIWHGANWTFLVWGMYYGILLILEKFVFQKLLKTMSNGLRRGLTLLLVMIGWVFFFSPDIGSAFRWLGQMFGIGSAGFLGSIAKYYFAGSWLTILIGIFAAYPMASTVGRSLCRRGTGAVYGSVLWFALLLALSIAGMMTSTYSSFLYFQF